MLSFLLQNPTQLFLLVFITEWRTILIFQFTSHNSNREQPTFINILVHTLEFIMTFSLMSYIHGWYRTEDVILVDQ